MATTTASLTISSGDLTGDALSLSTSTQLKKAGVSTGLDQTTGVARKVLATTSVTTLLTASEYGSNKAHKLFVRNISSSASESITITVGSQDIGKLFGGDFIFTPWEGSADLKVSASDANMTVEFLLIYEA
tara:strand:- start:1749 stop:2141 length:393 start_codon:yes stop_codon:yes gene_type:complete